MKVDAYVKKGIKRDESSPIFDMAIKRKWIVPVVDGYILDVAIP